MGRRKNTEYTPVPQQAPEYTEQIHWRRVALVMVPAAILVLGALWTVHRLLHGDQPATPVPVLEGRLPDRPALATDADTPKVVSGGEAPPERAAGAEPAEDHLTHPAVANTNPEPAATLSAQSGVKASEPGAEPSAREQTATAEPMPEAPSTATALAQADAPQAVSEPGADPDRTVPLSVQVTIHEPAVTRALLTDSMHGLEPGTPLVSTDGLPQGFIKLYFFTDIQGRAGGRLTYRWYHNDQAVASVRVGVGSDRWRSHASKNISTGMRGRWRVTVTDRKGRLLAESEFFLPPAAGDQA